jgi:hypothetical protein
MAEKAVEALYGVINGDDVPEAALALKFGAPPLSISLSRYLCLTVTFSIWPLSNVFLLRNRSF